MAERVAVIGAGSWGTAFAVLAAEQGDPVTLWARRAELAEKLQRGRVSSEYLEGLALPDSLVVTADLGEAVRDASVVVTAVPSHAMREVVRGAAPAVSSDAVVMNLSKGIEQGSLARMSELLAQELGRPGGDAIACLSGPNHAEEVGRRIPSATVVACPDTGVAKSLQKRFMRDYFRVYTNDDLVGVECAGAAKNVIAIAAGASDGLGFGDNTKASLITRGLAEVTRFGVALGARPLTFLGLAGVGDLVVTCMSEHSRNRAVGELLASGKTREEITSHMRMVAEGIRTAPALEELSTRLGVEMPITSQVAAVLDGRVDVRQTVMNLMGRDPAEEER